MRAAVSTRTTALGMIAAGALFMSSCGGGETEAGPGDEVASLDDDEPAETVDEPAAERAGSVDDVEQAALDFSACLREQGIDIPDIGVDADGNISLRDAFQGSDIDRETMRSATRACGEILEGIGFGGGGRGQIADNPEIADALLEFSACVRVEGFEDVPDLTLGGGQSPDQQGDGQPPAEGRGEEGFGDRNARFAAQLGLDPDDPDVAAALAECAPIVDQAFADAGVGQRGGGNG